MDLPKEEDLNVLFLLATFPFFGDFFLIFLVTFVFFLETLAIIRPPEALGFLKDAAIIRPPLALGFRPRARPLLLPDFLSRASLTSLLISSASSGNFRSTSRSISLKEGFDE